jgi:uncharacterized protein DUF3987
MAEENETLDQVGQDDGEDGAQPSTTPSTRKAWDWLDAYVDFTKDFEPPQVFNKWCGLVALATALGRKVWLEEANTKIYPNLFVVLVASSGVGKTTAMREVQPFVQETGVAISDSKTSAAKFLTSMAESNRLVEGAGIVTPYLVWAEELPSFLGMDAYKSGLLADLTTLYDCPDLFTKGTHVHQVETITNAYLCMLAGTTAEGLFDVMPPGSVTQGFTARLLFIHAFYNERRVVEKPWTERHRKLDAALRHDMRVIAGLSGPARFSDVARVMWVDYYMNRPHAADEFVDTRLQGYASRKPFYVKKLALLLSVSESDSLVVEAQHLDKAFKLVAEVDRTLTRVYEDIAPSMVIKSYGKIIRNLQRHGGVLSKTDIMRAYAYTMDTMDIMKAMAALQDQGLVELHMTNPKTGRPATVYRLTEAGRKWDGK